eukprot:COSAG02_NODE_3311_length_6956_cov_3.255359_2_plen_53_part_00
MLDLEEHPPSWRAKRELGEVGQLPSCGLSFFKAALWVGMWGQWTNDVESWTL